MFFVVSTTFRCFAIAIQRYMHRRRIGAFLFASSASFYAPHLIGVFALFTLTLHNEIGMSLLICASRVCESSACMRLHFKPMFLFFFIRTFVHLVLMISSARILSIIIIILSAIAAGVVCLPFATKTTVPLITHYENKFRNFFFLCFSQHEVNCTAKSIAVAELISLSSSNTGLQRRFSCRAVREKFPPQYVCAKQNRFDFYSIRI